MSSAYAIYRIAYSEGTIRLLAGSAGVRGDQDGTLTTSLFSLTTYLRAIGTDVLLIADMRNYKLKRLDIKSDRVSTVNVCTNCLQSPTSVLVAQDSLYIGQKQNILKFKCEPIYSFFVHGTNYFTSLLFFSSLHCSFAFVTFTGLKFFQKYFNAHYVVTSSILKVLQLL